MRDCVHLDIYNVRPACIEGHHGGFPSPGVCSVCKHHHHRPKPMEEEDWPLVYKIIGKLRNDEDIGVGDTFARNVKVVGSIIKEIAGKECPTCAVNRRIWNIRFPYRHPNSVKLSDVSYVINLDRRQDRLERFTDEYHAFGKPFGKVERFRAIEGSMLKPPWRRWPDSIGAWGCLHSHIAVLEKGLAAGAKSILVFEDDAAFLGRERVNLLRQVPEDWDAIFLGGEHYDNAAINEHVFRCRHTYCMHAYVVRGRIIDALLFEMKKKYAGSDSAFANIQVRFNVYGLNPQIVGQHRGYSDLTGGMRERRIF